MHQGDFHSHYSYNPQQQYIAPKRGVLEKVFGDRGARIIKSPLIATVGLLLTGAAIAAIIVAAYPQGEGGGSIPIVQADARPFKTEPIEAGGMDIPNRDSTIFETLQSADAGAEGRRVENLLAPDEVEPASGQLQAVNDITAPAVTKPVEPPKQASLQAQAPKPAVKADAKQPPETLHVPGSSPETLAFVRSVLDKEEASDTAKTMNDVTPAAGPASTSGKAIAGGNYFVQLVSITDESAAPKEWSKMQAAYSSMLADSDYRVQRADLGEKGIYYRLQAGPFSQEQASNICAQIKAQKPGGCLVVK